VQTSASRPANAITLAVNILSVATATPEYAVSQKEAFQRVKSVAPAFERYESIYANSGIERRYSCVPPDWCHKQHGWAERTTEYQRHARALLNEVAVKAMTAAGLSARDIDVIITNSTSGIACAPSLDMMMINSLGLREGVTRLPIYGYGCSGGVAGLAHATQLAHSMPGANVLFLTIDLSSLNTRHEETLTNFVATGLFGDGAAAVILRSPGNGARPAQSATDAPRICATGEHSCRETENYIGLDVRDDGFAIVLNPALPSLLRENLLSAVTQFLARHELTLMDFDGFLIHPGGRKILETAEDVLGISREQDVHAWSVLRDYGNMSSATIMFMLERALTAGAKGRHLIAAFGIGFSAHFAVADF
jgi:alkylresorcinol/alkylpyrone synthase